MIIYKQFILNREQCGGNRRKKIVPLVHQCELYIGSFSLQSLVRVFHFPRSLSIQRFAFLRWVPYSETVLRKERRESESKSDKISSIIVFSPSDFLLLSVLFYTLQRQEVSQSLLFLQDLVGGREVVWCDIRRLSVRFSLV